MRMAKDPLGGGLLTILGVLAFGTGVYFLGIRPTLLPEDIRFTGIDDATLPQAFLDWLGIVFRTWAGSSPALASSLPGSALRPFQRTPNGCATARPQAFSWRSDVSHTATWSSTGTIWSSSLPCSSWRWLGRQF